MDNHWKKKIKSEVKSTVGFSEAKDKESFMVGVDVAIHKFEEVFENESHRLKSYEKSTDYLLEELRTISRIINKYSQEK